MTEFITGLVLGFAITMLMFSKPALTSMEKAYFDGQIDALTQDVRVNHETCSWKKSPWDDGTEPRFKPFITDCK